MTQNASPQHRRAIAAGIAALSTALPLLAQQPEPAKPPAEAPGAPPAAKPAKPKPWRLNDALGLPEWLKISGEHRSRFESLTGQFRSSPALRDNQDDYYARTLLRADVAFDPLAGTFEVIDARGYDLQSNAFADTTTINTFDLLQANASLDLGSSGSSRHRLLIGRETVDLGSRRLMARNAFRNTINAFDGIDYFWQNDTGSSVRAFWTMPVNRFPSARAELVNLDHEADRSDLDQQFGGVFGTHRFADRVSAEAYVFVLNETVPTNTTNRELYTPGFRAVLAPEPGGVFAEVESAYQFGERGGDDVRAWFAHGSVGFQFDAAWQPTVRVAWDYASGDRRSGDGKWNRFDTLFGARRFEYGPTGIYGSIARSNLNSPELRFSVKPTKNTWAMVAWRDIRLASDRDSWTTAGSPNVRDGSGASGDHVGQQVELRLQWDVMPKSLRIEGGGAYLARGSFLEQAPNAKGGDTRYFYLEAIWTF